MTGYFICLQIDTTLCGGWCAQTYSGLGCGANCAERIPDPRNFDSEHSRPPLGCEMGVTDRFLVRDF